MHDNWSHVNKYSNRSSTGHYGNLEMRRNLWTDTFSGQLDRLIEVTSHVKLSILKSATILWLIIQPKSTWVSTIRGLRPCSSQRIDILQQKCGLVTCWGYWLVHVKRRKCVPRPTSTLLGRARPWSFARLLWSLPRTCVQNQGLSLKTGVTFGLLCGDYVTNLRSCL